MFFQFILQMHRFLSSIVLDHGRKFTNKFKKTLCQQLDITVKLLTTHHLETDSQTKKANQELK